MSTDIPLLSNVRVAAPCSASWNDMDAVDGDRVHFCAGCKKNVYNLSAMTQNQAEGLLRKHEGHLCVRYYKRTDGTILTQNCPVGQAALRMKMIARSKQAAMATVVLASFGALGAARMASLNRNAIMGRRVGANSSPVGHSFRGQVPVQQEHEPDPVMGMPMLEPPPPSSDVFIPTIIEMTDTTRLGKYTFDLPAAGSDEPRVKGARGGSLIEAPDPELHPDLKISH